MVFFSFYYCYDFLTALGWSQFRLHKFWDIPISAEQYNAAGTPPVFAIPTKLFALAPPFAVVIWKRQ